MTFGCIGYGNMARALIGGMVAAGVVAADTVVVSDVSAHGKAMAREAGFHVAAGNAETAAAADTLLLAAKPHQIPDIIREISPAVRPDALVLSIAAGVPLRRMGEAFGRQVKLVRLMPNTPALTGEGMTAICPGPLVGAEELETVTAMLRSCGRCEVMPESLIDAVVGLSGSGPAYVFLFIEALADGAVREGMAREQAYVFAAQTVLGSARLVLESGTHPGALKDMVCSPAGTTIEGVGVLEAKGFRSAVMDAVRAGTARSRELSR